MEEETQVAEEEASWKRISVSMGPQQTCEFIP
jgi:hypothetical protein